MNGDRPRYRVTHVQDSANYDAVRGTHRTKQVHYVHADGTKSYVELPEDVYDPDTVKTALDNAATVHEQVKGITPDSSPIGILPQSNPWQR